MSFATVAEQAADAVKRRTDAARRFLPSPGTSRSAASIINPVTGKGWRLNPQRKGHQMQLQDIITRCADITASKGFDVSQHGTQVALMVTEAAEALEHITPAGDMVTDWYIRQITLTSTAFERYRKETKDRQCDYQDVSAVVNEEGLLEELADIMIRVCSYVGGNGQTKQFVAALLAKIEKNAGRPQRHGKAF